MLRLIDFLKSRGVTGVFTSLTNGGARSRRREVGISSLIDTWLLLRELEAQRRAQPRAVRPQVARAWRTRTRSASSSSRGRASTCATPTWARRACSPVPRGSPGGAGEGGDGCRAEQATRRRGATRAQPAQRSRRRSRRCGASSRPEQNELERRIAESAGARDTARGRPGGDGAEPARGDPERESPPRRGRRARRRPEPGRRHERQGAARRCSTRHGARATRPRPANAAKPRAICGSSGSTSRARAAEVRLALREPEAAVRGAPRRPLLDRGRRPRSRTRSLARGDQIVAIPTLVRKLPEPIRKIVGDLSNTERRSSACSCGRGPERPMPRGAHQRRRAGRARAPASGRRYVLRLYVTGMTPRSARAIANLRRDLRGAPARAATSSRSSTSTAHPQLSRRRADHRRADADQEAAAAAAPHRRRPLRRRARPAWARPAAGAAGRDHQLAPGAVARRTPRAPRRAPSHSLRRELHEARRRIEAIRTRRRRRARGPTAGRRARLHARDRRPPYRQMVEQMQQGAAALSDAGLVVYANPRLHELLDLDAHALAGLPFDSLFPEERRDEVACAGGAGSARALRDREPDAARGPARPRARERFPARPAGHGGGRARHGPDRRAPERRARGLARHATARRPRARTSSCRCWPTSCATRSRRSATPSQIMRGKRRRPSRARHRRDRRARCEHMAGWSMTCSTCRASRGASCAAARPGRPADRGRAAIETSAPLIAAAGTSWRCALPAEPLPIDADAVRLTQVDRQPAQQRGQVHGSAAAASRWPPARRGGRPSRGARHRHRHQPRRAAAHLRRLLAAAGRRRALAGRARDRAVAGARPGRAARRRHPGDAATGSAAAASS